MNSNFFLSDFSNEHDCNWEFQLENMVSKLVDESEQSFNSNIFEEENVFNFGDTSKEDKTLSPQRNQDATSSTISSSPKANCLKYERSNVKSSTFNGKTYFKNDILFKSIAPSKSYPQSSQCLFGYSLYDNSSNQNVTNEENNLETLLNKITSQLTQHEQITLEVYQMIKGKFINIIKSHKGSKLFQSYLKKTQYSIIYLIYQELQYDLVGIISNLYSNYFFTKFYTCLHKKHRIEIISIITNHFITLSCDNIGAFPIQSIIEQAHTKYEKNLILKIIHNNLDKLMYDPYGCHVIAKIISCFERKYINGIFTYIINNLPFLTEDQNGICVIKAFITYLSKQNNAQNDLYQSFYNFLLNNFGSIVHNQYGNQVIKTVVKLCDIDLIRDLLVIIQTNSLELSIGKFSSIIIETFIEKSPVFLEIYIRNLHNNNLLFEIMRNNFGKFVIQKALKISTGPIHEFLLNYITFNYSRFPDIKQISQWKTILEHNNPSM